MYILDSSVWIALFLDFDTQHEKAREVFEFLRGKNATFEKDGNSFKAQIEAKVISIAG